MGSRQSCSMCRQSFEMEMHVWYGTNPYNFEKLESPQAYELILGVPSALPNVLS